MTKRMSIEMSDRFSKRLEALARETGLTKTEILRRGFEIMDAGAEALRESYRVGAWLEDDQGHVKRTREFIGFGDLDAERRLKKRHNEAA